MRTESNKGKFHGAIAPTTPTGVFMTILRFPSVWWGMMRPYPRFPSSANQRSQAKAEESLDANIKMQNSANSLRQIERLQRRYEKPAGQPPGAAAGEFR